MRINSIQSSNQVFKGLWGQRNVNEKTVSYYPFADETVTKVFSSKEKLARTTNNKYKMDLQRPLDFSSKEYAIYCKYPQRLPERVLMEMKDTFMDKELYTNPRLSVPADSHLSKIYSEGIIEMNTEELEDLPNYSPLF